MNANSPLPSSAEFLAGFGISAEPTAEQKPVIPKAKIPQPPGGVSQEFKRLLVHYCASQLEAFDLASVKWNFLAKQLGTQPDFLREAAEAANAEGELWHSVFEERIRRAGALKLFRDADWEKLESSALQRLLYMAERGLIKDVGELLAVARAARQAVEVRTPTHGAGNNSQVNINFNGGGPMADSELPGAGAKMTIDLSPRSAQALAQAKEREAGGNRVIDSEMLTAEELRGILTTSKQPAEPLSIEHSDSGEQA